MRSIYAVILPACDEAESIRHVLKELKGCLDSEHFVVAVGVNGTSDATASIARDCGVFVAKTTSVGYGHGCQAAIDLIEKTGFTPEAYIFMAADGANHPGDIQRLVRAYEMGYDFVLGSRTRFLRNVRSMTLQHIVINRLLGLWCFLLVGKYFSDLGPLRLIERRLFHQLRMREWTYGWTIEAQAKAAVAGAAFKEISVTERRRVAGTQKVSGVSAWQSLRIGFQIVSAGLRSRRSADELVSSACLGKTRRLPTSCCSVEATRSDPLSTYSWKWCFGSNYQQDLNPPPLDVPSSSSA